MRPRGFAESPVTKRCPDARTTPRFGGFFPNEELSIIAIAGRRFRSSRGCAAEPEHSRRPTASPADAADQRSDCHWQRSVDLSEEGRFLGTSESFCPQEVC